MNTYNKLTLGLFLAALFTFNSCSTSRSTIDEHKLQLDELEREDYVVLDRVEGEARSTKFWLLFLPFGGTKEEKLKQKAYNRAIEQMPEADGLIKPRYQVKKTVIPLILINFSVKRVTAIGKGFRIKTDSELQVTKN